MGSVLGVKRSGQKVGLRNPDFGLEGFAPLPSVAIGSQVSAFSQSPIIGISGELAGSLRFSSPPLPLPQASAVTISGICYGDMKINSILELANPSVLCPNLAANPN
ncbi:MAG: hypothetical protein ACP5D7_21280 [Limnospira sp.]